MNKPESLINKIEHAKDLDYRMILEQSIELFKNLWQKGFIVVSVIVVCAIGINFLFGLIGLSPFSYNLETGFDLESFSQNQTRKILYAIPQNIIISALTIALVGGFYRMCKQFILGQTLKDDYFYFFKKDYYPKLLMLGILYTGIATIAQLLCFVPYLYVFVPLSYFSIVFAMNPHFTETDIVKTSFKIGNKKWFITFGTMVVTGLLAMLGILACFVGILFTMCLVYLPVFLIYGEVVGFEGTSDIDQIGAGEDSENGM
ncbi:hypothetical protein [Aestuariivivens sediminis]|uniref:hypothetical protein n=1 Tax=Aestuariivivens sediminis TaxID=2913557 RepID=UPI001F562ECF|nr:hypothetical protein [Aestuariivivens sediminis]